MAQPFLDHLLVSNPFFDITPPLTFTAEFSLSSLASVIVVSLHTTFIRAVLTIPTLAKLSVLLQLHSEIKITHLKGKISTLFCHSCGHFLQASLIMFPLWPLKAVPQKIDFWLVIPTSTLSHLLCLITCKLVDFSLFQSRREDNSYPKQHVQSFVSVQQSVQEITSVTFIQQKTLPTNVCQVSSSSSNAFVELCTHNIYKMFNPNRFRLCSEAAFNQYCLIVSIFFSHLFAIFICCLLSHS